MKTIGKLMLTTAIVLLIGAFAQAQDNTPKTKTVPSRPAFVDKNNDGICDNFAAGNPRGRGANFVDKNNDGICDNFAAGNPRGRGANFVDKNNDGICDNRASGRNLGRGHNYVDANNDGICDHRNDGAGRGQGYRHRHGQGQFRGNTGK